MMRTSALRVSAAMSAATLAARRPAPHSVRDQALAGLRSDAKTLPAALFYDARGAELFERICETAEYYPTRTEIGILDRYAGEIAAMAGPRTALIEYGSGAGVKVRFLLDRLMDAAAYVPVDISREQLVQVAGERSRQYPAIPIRPVCADYTAPFELPALPAGARRVAFFPGSTIGNFHPTEAAAFLHRVRHAVGPGGALVLGVDRRKDERVLHAAYNDAGGVTAAFNLNLLARLNREVGAQFDLGAFRHLAFFNDAASRIEMHLESQRDQTVCVGGVPVAFRRGETIHTECSYKYDEERLDALVRAAGFRVERLWTDAREWFWVGFLVPG
ncbi:MAG TPA: L-histidine N(alpha)-methyltransferase [Gemmatimonadaceae bacterium]|nr:L-histidine N(alpha)-methyltransferase [Gemmatimonadaceae bacterium]